MTPDEYGLLARISGMTVDFPQKKASMHIDGCNSREMATTIKLFQAICPGIHQIDVSCDNNAGLTYSLEGESWKFTPGAGLTGHEPVSHPRFRLG